MPIVTTSGFILRKNHFKEADKIVVIFSENLGKISALGKSAKKSVKRNLNLLDYGYLLKFYLQTSQNRQYYFIEKIELIEQLYNLNNTSLLFLNHFFNELILNIVYSHEDSEKLYNLAIKFLKNLRTTDKPKILSSLMVFLLKLLKLTGYGLNIKCGVCGCSDRIINYSLENLTFMCNKCKNSKVLGLCSGSLKFINNIDKINFLNINLSQQIIDEIEIIFLLIWKKFYYQIT